MRKIHLGLAALLCVFLMAGCSNTEPEGSAPAQPSAEGSVSNVSFISGMGCDDPACTDPAHHHDCPEDCTDYDHYHHCGLDCDDPSHGHHDGEHHGEHHDE